MKRLLAIVLVTFSIDVLAPPYEVAIVPYKIRMNGEWKRLFVILPEDFFRVVQPPIDNFDMQALVQSSENLVLSREVAAQLFPVLQSRFIRGVETHGRLRDQRMRDALLQLEEMGRGRYAGIAITDLEHTDQVLALLSFVTPNPSAPRSGNRLLWEKRLVGRGLSKGLAPLPIQIDRNAREPIFAWNPHAAPGELPLWFLPTPGLTGEDQEVKTWVAWPNGLADYSYVMYLVAELHKISRRSGRLWPVEFIPHWQNELMMWNRQTQTNLLAWLPDHRTGMQKIVGPELVRAMEDCSEIRCIYPEMTQQDCRSLPNRLSDARFPPICLNSSPELGVRIGRYSIEFDVDPNEVARGKRSLLDVYTEMGWQIFDSTENPDMPGSRTYVATLDREGWLKSLGGYFLNRAVRRPLTDLVLEQDPSWARSFIKKGCPKIIAN